MKFRKIVSFLWPPLSTDSLTMTKKFSAKITQRKFRKSLIGKRTLNEDFHWPSWSFLDFCRKFAEYFLRACRKIFTRKSTWSRFLYREFKGKGYYRRNEHLKNALEKFSSFVTICYETICENSESSSLCITVPGSGPN